MNATSSSPPKSCIEVLQKLGLLDGLPPDDPRWVDTTKARGSELVFKRLAAKLGWDISTQQFFPPTKSHILYFGHIGCGKSTELQRYAVNFKTSGRYFPVLVDTAAKLDTNNLDYSEVVMAMAECLFEALQRDSDLAASIPSDALKPLQDWFRAVVESGERRKEFSAEAKSGIEAGGGLLGLLKLTSTFTAGFKANSTYKSEWRAEIRNRFSDLARAFNQFVADVQAGALKGKRVLFIVDRTDKLRGEDTKNFFVLNANQLLEIDAFVIYTAPLHLKYDGGLSALAAQQITLPMVKLVDASGVKTGGAAVMRDMLLARADASLFKERAIETLVDMSGGSPRELLRLLKYACEFADDVIDDAVVQQAVKQLASEHRNQLEIDDYPALVAIDKSPKDVGHDQRIRRFLLNGQVFEYNDGTWRTTNPVVRTLEGYTRSAQSVLAAPPPVIAP